MQFFAVWIDPKYEPDKAFDRTKNVLENFTNEYNENIDYLHIIKNANDVDFAIKNNKIGALLSIEGGGAIEGDISKLHSLYEMGIRAMTLTWNGRNQIADGALVSNAKGLTKFGFEVISEMNRLNMIVDVSHLSDEGFWDVAKNSKSIFIASHSNARKICNHPRNLTDDQIRHIIKIKGFMGINLYPKFLCHDKAEIYNVLKHIDYVLSLGGENILGFGCDFDGVDSLPRGIRNVTHLNRIVNEFFKIGYKEKLINKILYGNLHKAVKSILKNQNK